MSRVRRGVPLELATEVMFASDSTCCKCRERGKAVQLHHIDEDPSNNVAKNLAVLCLQCHNETQINGGFGRSLNAPLVARYRDEWLERVKRRRDKADEQAVSRQVEPAVRSVVEEDDTPHIPRDAPLAYINSLPAFRSELRKHAQVEWDTGVTSRVVQASYDYIDALQGTLVTLSNYMSPGQFGGKAPREFFAEAIAARFLWHRTHAEPQGPGTGGTIVNIICAERVLSDVERMVEDVAMSLAGYDESFDWSGWRDRWRA